MKPILAVACASLFASPLWAQCANAWQSFGSSPGVDGFVHAMTRWDPDGAGPLPERLVVGGKFATAGAVAARGVAAWDPATGQWAAFGAGFATPLSTVLSLLALPNGDLIAGCQAFPPGGMVVPTLLRWSGAAWSPFGGLSGTPTVTALAQLPNGNLAVGGSFTTAGATPVPYLGIWNGTSWFVPGGGMNAPVHELLVLPNGDLLALGDFTLAGGVPADGVARWNGLTWSALGQGIAGRGEAAVVLPNGDLVVGGMFATAGGVPAANLARWDGTAWSEFGGGVTGFGYSGIGVRSLALQPNGDLVVAGFFQSAGSSGLPDLARWDGSSWSSFGFGGVNGRVNAVATLPGGDLVAGGYFSIAGGVGASFIARWDGGTWAPLSNGTAPNWAVRSLLTLSDGSFVAGGSFRVAGTVPADGIARWNGVAWSPLGSGLLQYGGVNALRQLSNGDLLAGGRGFVGRWDGASWTLLAASMVGAVPHPDMVEAVAELPNGDLVVGGDFAEIDSTPLLGLARWDGTAWSALGGQQPGEVHALTTLANGDLVVGGYFWAMFPSIDGIARWNGTAWSPLGAGLQLWGSPGTAWAIAEASDGSLIVGGEFTTAGGQPARNIARWNGVSWSPLGTGANGRVRTVHVLPNGDVLAAGDFTQAGGVIVNGMARWNGSSWATVPAGASSTSFINGIYTTAALPDGDVMVGGYFGGLGGQVSPNLIRLTTSCPAQTQSNGGGCAGAALTATLPWTGATWRATASNLPPAALVAAVSGVATTTLPLASVFATALSGCTLRVQPDQVELVVGSGGAASLQFAFPNNPALAGIVFNHQMVSIALDSTLAVAATNALQLTVGSF